jgi:large exoprotein involved in heme utilization and adhesion
VVCAIGNVQINIQDINPGTRSVKLAATPVDPTRLIAQSCPAVKGNRFTVSGCGGLPPTPQQALNDDSGWQDWRMTGASDKPSDRQGKNFSPIGDRSANSLSSPLVEANGWAIDDRGQIVLTASAPDSTPPPSSTCPDVS